MKYKQSIKKARISHCQKITKNILILMIFMIGIFMKIFLNLHSHEQISKKFIESKSFHQVYSQKKIIFHKLNIGVKFLIG